MGKEKKINVLTAFIISYKSGVKTFLKWIINQCPKALVNIYIYIYIYNDGMELLVNKELKYV